jgi:hypothetical protein
MTDTPNDHSADGDRATHQPANQRSPETGESSEIGTPIVVRRGAAMRRALLHKLPQLEHDATSSLAGIELDRDRELLGAVELDVDAFLVPLAATRRRERR